MWDKKQQMQTIMKRRRNAEGGLISSGSPVKPEIVKDADGEFNQLHVAAEEMLSAFQEKSAEALMRALVNFIDMYENQPHEEMMAEED